MNGVFCIFVSNKFINRRNNMRIVIQRVNESSVAIGGEVHSAIGHGFMVLVGVREDDTADDVKWLAQKTVNLRVFDDDAGVMNRNILDAGGEVLAVSQFTLNASTKKGNRPSYIHAAGHELAVPLYEMYCQEVEQLMGKEVKRGVFGAEMQVSLINDGPVTIIIDSKLRE